MKSTDNGMWNNGCIASPCTKWKRMTRQSAAGWQGVALHVSRPHVPLSGNFSDGLTGQTPRRLHQVVSWFQHLVSEHATASYIKSLTGVQVFSVSWNCCFTTVMNLNGQATSVLCSTHKNVRQFFPPSLQKENAKFLWRNTAKKHNFPRFSAALPFTSLPQPCCGNSFGNNFLCVWRQRRNLRK